MGRTQRIRIFRFPIRSREIIVSMLKFLIKQNEFYSNIYRVSSSILFQLYRFISMYIRLYFNNNNNNDCNKKELSY